MCVWGGGGSAGVRIPSPPEKLKKIIGFLRNAGPDHLKNHQNYVAKPAFNSEPSWARQWNAILNGVSLAGR